jgi:hypothetical protein
MRHYGTTTVGPIVMIRYEVPINQHMYLLPLQHSNTEYRSRADVWYMCEGSGPITITECNTNPTLVGTVFEPGQLYVLNDLLGNNIVKIESGNTIPIVTPMHSIRRHFFEMANASLAVVNGSFTLPSNTYAAIVEGTVTIGNTVADSNSDLYVIGERNTETTITGNGKLVTFQINLTD